MNHSVFKDLVPSYIENLTSEETNRQMQEHMEQCEDCRKYYIEMKEGFSDECFQEKKKENKNVDYLKKVRARNRKKILIITGTLLALFIMIFVGYYFLFVHMWAADEKNVQTTIQKKDDVVTVHFQSKKDNRYLLAMEEYGDQGYGETIIVYENWNIFADSSLNKFSELASSVQDGTDVTYTFLDENNLVLPNGKETKLTNQDKIQIVYKNSMEEIPLKTLYEQATD